MIVVPDPQGSPGWLAARAGVVTASCADDILTKTGKPATGKALLARIVAERLLGEPMEAESSGFMERGHELEAEARDWFAFDQDVEPVLVGLCLRDDRLLGASPDALIGDDAGFEAKCPSAAVHVRNLVDPEAFEVEHKGQCQVGMIVTERRTWHLVSYHPTLPKVHRVVRYDEDYARAFLAALDAFNARVAEAVERITSVDPRYVTTSTGSRVPSPL